MAKDLFIEQDHRKPGEPKGGISSGAINTRHPGCLGCRRQNLSVKPVSELTFKWFRAYGMIVVSTAWSSTVGSGAIGV